MKLNDYILKFDEINALSQAFTGSERKDKAELFNTAYDLLFDAYIEGWLFAQDYIIDAGKDSISDRAYDSKRVEQLIFKQIENEDAFDRLDQAHSDDDVKRINKILETEFHRMFNAGGIDRADASDQKSTIYKRWQTMLDDKVRETHNYLEDIAVPIDAEFITFDGDSALYPGDFANAENNVNCRCWLKFT